MPLSEEDATASSQGPRRGAGDVWTWLILAAGILSYAWALMTYASEALAHRPLQSGDLYAVYLRPLLLLEEGRGVQAWRALYHGPGRMPGYSALLYLLHAVSGERLELIDAPLATNLLVFVGLGLLIFALAKRLSPSPRLGLASAGVALGCAPWVSSFWDAATQATPDLVYAAMGTGLAAILVGPKERSTPLGFFVAGVLCGLAVLLRFNGISLLLPALAVCLLPDARGDGPGRLGRTLALLVGLALAWAPWSVTSHALDGCLFHVEFDGNPVYHPALLEGSGHQDYFAYLRAEPWTAFVRGTTRGLWSGPAEVITRAWGYWTVGLAVSVAMIWAAKREVRLTRRDATVALMAFVSWVFVAAVHFEARYYLSIWLLLIALLASLLVRGLDRFDQHSGLVVGAVPIGVMVVAQLAQLDRAPYLIRLPTNQLWYQAQGSFLEHLRECTKDEFQRVSTGWGSNLFTPAGVWSRELGFEYGGFEPPPPLKSFVYADLRRDPTFSTQDPFARLPEMWPIVLEPLSEGEIGPQPALAEVRERSGTLRRTGFLVHPARLEVEVGGSAALLDRNYDTAASRSTVLLRPLRPVWISGITLAAALDSEAEMPTEVRIDGVAVQASPACTSAASRILELQLDPTFVQSSIEMSLPTATKLAEIVVYFQPPPAPGSGPALRYLENYRERILVEAPGTYVWYSQIEARDGARAFKLWPAQAGQSPQLYGIPRGSKWAVGVARLEPGHYRVSAQWPDGPELVGVPLTNTGRVTLYTTTSSSPLP